MVAEGWRAPRRCSLASGLYAAETQLPDDWTGALLVAPCRPSRRRQSALSTHMSEAGWQLWQKALLRLPLPVRRHEAVSCATAAVGAVAEWLVHSQLCDSSSGRGCVAAWLCRCAAVPLWECGAIVAITTAVIAPAGVRQYPMASGGAATVLAVLMWRHAPRWCWCCAWCHQLRWVSLATSAAGVIIGVTRGCRCAGAPLLSLGSAILRVAASWEKSSIVYLLKRKAVKTKYTCFTANPGAPGSRTR